MAYQIDQLRALEAVVDEGSFEAAATALGVTSPAVSQRIKALESAVGAVLLVRTRPVRPTQTGEILLRLARQVGLAMNEAESALLGPSEWTAVRVAINADSLATWALPPLAEAARTHRLAVEVVREDESTTTDLLRRGEAMAAVTSVSEPVQGCSVARLGAQRYRAVASPAFVDQWFPSGLTGEQASVAPVAVFDRNDGLQNRVITSLVGDGALPPREHIPGSSEYVRAIVLGMAWGLVPDVQSAPYRESGDLVPIPRGLSVDVPLYWQQWRIRSTGLETIARTVAAAAHRHLRQAPGHALG